MTRFGLTENVHAWQTFWVIRLNVINPNAHDTTTFLMMCDNFLSLSLKCDTKQKFWFWTKRVRLPVGWTTFTNSPTSSEIWLGRHVAFVSHQHPRDSISWNQVSFMFQMVYLKKWKEIMSNEPKIKEFRHFNLELSHQTLSIRPTYLSNDSLISLNPMLNPYNLYENIHFTFRNATERKKKGKGNAFLTWFRGTWLYIIKVS